MKCKQLSIVEELLLHLSIYRISEGRLTWEDEEEDVSSYRMTLRKRGDTVKKKEEALNHTLWNSALEEAVDFRQKR